MGIVLVFLVCHTPRNLLSFVEMVTIRFTNKKDIFMASQLVQKSWGQIQKRSYANFQIFSYLFGVTIGAKKLGPNSQTILRKFSDIFAFFWRHNSCEKSWGQIHKRSYANFQIFLHFIWRHSSCKKAGAKFTIDLTQFFGYFCNF